MLTLSIAWNFIREPVMIAYGFGAGRFWNELKNDYPGNAMFIPTKIFWTIIWPLMVIIVCLLHVWDFLRECISDFKWMMFIKKRSRLGEDNEHKDLQA